MSIGRIEKDLLTFLLAIWVKVPDFMIYPFERQFNAEIPSSFYQGHFSLLSAISVKRGKNICYPEVLMFQEWRGGGSSYLRIFHGGSILFDSIHQQSILLSLHHSQCHHQNRPHQYNHPKYLQNLNMLVGIVNNVPNVEYLEIVTNVNHF